MPSETAHKTICKTVCQYNSSPLSDEDMKKLLDIAADYRTVKSYVYQRYGSIRSLSKLYPGYTVQNEMTASGFRAQLGLPSVYFYLAVFDALGDIKSQWTRTKSSVKRAVGQNKNFTENEKHYLRFLLKTNDAFEGVLMNLPPGDWKLPMQIRRRYDELTGQLMENGVTEKLHRYLCRKVRKYHVKPHSDAADGFFSSRGTHRYGDHGIYITTKEQRKRIFIPLTDGNEYKSQIFVKLFPEEHKTELRAAIQTAVRFHPDYVNQVGISLGMSAMLTTHEGHVYGEKLGFYQDRFSDWMREQVGKYNANRHTEPGRKKYNATRHRLKERLHSYINMELNHFLREEKPRTIYLPKLPPPKGSGAFKKINYSASMWQRGYIRERLEQKCREQSITLIKVYAKDISRQCSRCGAPGHQEKGSFCCPACGFHADIKTNAAQNAKKRGQDKSPPPYTSITDMK